MPNPYYADGRALREKNRLAVADGGFDVAAWVLDQLDLSRPIDVLDAGTGWGRFAAPLAARVQAASSLTCCDVWPGMVATCRETLADRAAYLASDVRALPFGAHRFDLVLANHMLYELEDVAPAARELARVVRPGGVLVATTYSDAVRIPLLELHRAAVGDDVPERPSTFSLENGAAALSVAFETVEVTTVDERVPVDPDRLTALYRTTGRHLAVAAERREHVVERFHDLAVAAVRREPGLSSVTRWAMFTARGPKPSHPVATVS